MKRHLGAILALCLLGSMSLPGCQAVESLGKSFDNLSWGKGQSSGTETKAMAAAGESIVADLPDNCPQIKVLDELSRITQFTNQKSPKNDEKIASARFTTLDATCSVAPNSVTLEITLDFEGEAGVVGLRNQGSEASFAYPYFLSVITPNGQILSKDVFALSMIYNEGKSRVHKQDRLRQTIPLMSGQQADEYQIVIGFQLSEDELAYNRSGGQ